jgi:uncharacterized protein
VRNWCNGGCPKDRFALSKDGEPGQNYLCAGLEKFFMHTGPTFNVMAQLYRKGHPPAEVMTSIAALDARRDAYQPCPCGSGSKFRFCHGDRDPKTPFSGVEPAAPQAQAQASAAAGQRS